MKIVDAIKEELMEMGHPVETEHPAPIYSGESKLVDDLSIDRPLLMELVTRIEARFDITIKDADIDKFKTIKDIVENIKYNF